MSQVGNFLHSYFAGDQDCALYNSNGDVMLPGLFNVRAGGASVFAESQDLTAGDSTTVLGNIRYIRSNGHVYGVCVSSRIVTPTLKFDTGTQTSYNNTPGAFTLYDMRILGNVGNNIRFDYTVTIGDAAYNHSVQVKEGSTSLFTATSSGSASFLMTRGSHTFTFLIAGDAAHGNSGRIRLFNAE